MKRTKIINIEGFTLVEVVVALAIFVVIAAFAFPIFLSSFKVNIGAQEKTQIQEVSQNYLEHVIYISKNKTNKESLVDTLENDMVYGLASYSSISNTLTLESDSYIIELEFDTESNLLKLFGKSIPGNQTFETVEWLDYGT